MLHHYLYSHPSAAQRSCQCKIRIIGMNLFIMISFWWHNFSLNWNKMLFLSFSVNSVAKAPKTIRCFNQHGGDFLASIVVWCYKMIPQWPSYFLSLKQGFFYFILLNSSLNFVFNFVKTKILWVPFRNILRSYLGRFSWLKKGHTGVFWTSF